MDWKTLVVTNDDKELVQEAAQNALQGDVTVVATRLFEVTNRDDYNERIFYIMWMREKQHPSAGIYGTHRCCINDNGESMLVLGHYDMDYKTALADLAERMRHSPVQHALEVD